MRALRLLSAVLLAGVGRISLAQRPETPLPPTRFGLTAGLNLTTFAGDGLGATANRHGFVGGVDLVTPFTQNFSTQVEALYSMKGMKSLGSNPQNYALFKLDYVDIPVMLRGDLPVTPAFQPFVLTGPSFDIKVSCGGDAVSGGNTTTATCDEIEAGSSSGTKFRTLDVGWVFGGGLGFDFHNRRISFSARYEAGLRTIATKGTSKNRALSFMASVEAPLPRKVRR
jgi:hypothetical protein